MAELAIPNVDNIEAIVAAENEVVIYCESCYCKIDNPNLAIQCAACTKIWAHKSKACRDDIFPLRFYGQLHCSHDHQYVKSFFDPAVNEIVRNINEGEALYFIDPKDACKDCTRTQAIHIKAKFNRSAYEEIRIREIFPLSIRWFIQKSIAHWIPGNFINQLELDHLATLLFGQGSTGDSLQTVEIFQAAMNRWLHAVGVFSYNAQITDRAQRVASFKELKKMIDQEWVWYRTCPTCLRTFHENFPENPYLDQLICSEGVHSIVWAKPPLGAEHYLEYHPAKIYHKWDNNKTVLWFLGDILENWMHVIEVNKPPVLHYSRQQPKYRQQPKVARLNSSASEYVANLTALRLNDGRQAYELPPNPDQFDLKKLEKYFVLPREGISEPRHDWTVFENHLFAIIRDVAENQESKDAVRLFYQNLRLQPLANPLIKILVLAGSAEREAEIYMDYEELDEASVVDSNHGDEPGEEKYELEQIPEIIFENSTLCLFVAENQAAQVNEQGTQYDTNDIEEQFETEERISADPVQLELEPDESPDLNLDSQPYYIVPEVEFDELPQDVQPSRLSPDFWRPW